MKSRTELSNIAAVLSEDVVTVMCTFPTGDKQYAYLCARTTAEKLTKGDYVLCEKADAFAVPCVAAVHSTCELDDLKIAYRWVVQRVDTDEVERLRTWASTAADDLYTRQRRAAQVAMAQRLVGEGGAPLTIAKLA